jgi:ABC-type sugar transport system ATPase subunit
VTVFRNGESQPPVTVTELDADDLISRMLGRTLSAMFPPRTALHGRTPNRGALKVEDLVTAGLAAPVTLSVADGEILGLAGQMGSGAGSLLRAIAGAQRVDSGEVLFAERNVTPRTIRAAIAHGIVYCSSDRKRDGVFAVRPVAENLTAPSLEHVTPRGWRSSQRERALARELAERFQISRERLRSRAGTLSGGNQQKVALAKLVGVDPGVLLIDEPTRGVDIGARAEIYGYMRTLADRGMSIIFTALDTLEVLGLADRIATFYRGRVVATYTHEDVDIEQVTRDITLPELSESAR